MEQFKTKYGSFSPDGREYHIFSPRTPKPWVNVVSNGKFGFVVSQTGGGFSWDTHSEFNRVTRWHQDMIQDNWGKYIYVKNNKTGEIWSPTWMPVKTEPDSYLCRYGFGYAVFETVFKEIKITLTMFVPENDSIEIWDVKIENRSSETADLSLFTYFEWVLGSSSDFHREFHKTFIETSFDEKINGIKATKRLWEIPLGDRGHWNIEYEYDGYFSSSRKAVSYDADKESFLGQYGSLQMPDGLNAAELGRKTGKWNDSVACLRIDLNAAPTETEDTAFFLGIVKRGDDPMQVISRYLSAEQRSAALDGVKQKWERILSTLEISTPDEAMNLAVNKWFRYQAIAGRLLARTAYYQQSGAFGFRDQLQDSLVYLPIDPEKTKEQIRLHSRHQFQDGTVLHWWHPISETGLQTKMTDDLLWLPFIIIHYLDETADYSILDINEPFYDNPDLLATLYRHCVLSIEKVLSRYSQRGLPLIGAGDWNDGLSAVGLDMKGESIWLAEFFYMILNRFAVIAEKKNDSAFAEICLQKASELKTAFDKYAWDGEWYFRATKDSGEKIGSSENTEGRIFLNAQSWSVMSGIAPEDKGRAAMKAVEKHLLKNNGALLLAPAYTVPDKFIGYLSRYAPGRRENGGVYTHAATWAIWAFAKLKDSKNVYKAYKNLNPIYSGLEPDKYIAEPYVTPGNIDGPDSPDYGMGGWTWYTGSASWFQKVCVDWILGIRADEKGLIIDPCIPEEWNGYTVRRMFRGAEILISVINDSHVSSGISRIEIDGKVCEKGFIDAAYIETNKGKTINVKAYLG